MSRKDLKIKVFMEMAKSISKLSTCSRLQVGSVIVSKDWRVLSTGYNARPSGVSHCKEDNPGGDKDLCNCCHSEMNAIAFLDGTNREDKMIFVTAFPCESCLKSMAAAGIKQIYYSDPYRYFESSAKLADLFQLRYEQVPEN